MFDKKEYMKKYYKKHKKRHDEQTKEWVEKHPDYQKSYYLRNREKKIKQVSDNQKKNLGKIQKNHRNWHHERRMKAFELLGGKCANPFNLTHPDWCNDWRCLQIDHINGGGSVHYNKRKTIGIISDVIKDPDRELKYQLLCANCNWIKRFKEKEHNQRYHNVYIEGGHPTN